MQDVRDSTYPKPVHLTLSEDLIQGGRAFPGPDPYVHDGPVSKNFTVVH